MARRRRVHPDEHENAERWLLTYADMITLLMAFFIMLYSMSQIDLKKFAAMTGSVQAQLGGVGMLDGSASSSESPEMTSGTPGIAPSLGAAEALQQRIQQALAPVLGGSGLSVSSDGDETRISIPGSEVFFAAGSAELRPKALAALQRLAGALAKQPCRLKVTGHTCNLPVRGGRYRSNWELSADRARNVAFTLIRFGGVEADSCAFMGYADTQPVASNATEAGRVQNRRVDIVVKPLMVTQQSSQSTSREAAVDIAPHLERVGPVTGEH